MKDNNKIQVNWENEISRSHFSKLYGRGTFALRDHNNLILAYNSSNEDNFHEKGKLTRINQKHLEDIFETDLMLWAPVLDKDNNDVYLVTSSIVHGNTEEKGVLFKFDANNILKWKYKLDGSVTSLPVIWQNSIFITDYSRSIRKGNIYRFSKDGDILLKKQIRAFNTYEPWIIEDKEQIIISYNNPKILEVFDFNGNTIKIKEVSDLGEILFSENSEGVLFAAINGALVAIDSNLSFLWEYRPREGFAYMAPVFDSTGDLFSLLSGQRLVGLDSFGREKWMVDVCGHGYQPCILNNEKIITVTSKPSGKKAKDEQFTTFIEIFSNAGKRVAYYELHGDIFHFAKYINDTIVLATNCTKIDVERESEIKSIKIFSLNLP